MKTITFYSYKGGVGRTLLLGNVAKYLSKFGQKVFALDFDLEAPGLHYKLTPTETSKPRANNAGLVAYIHALAFEGKRKTPLQKHVVEVERGDDRRGAIHLMPAGSVLTSEYWQQLARINWHEFFYSEGSCGVPFFLELKAKIEKEFSPDFLLIDSRTGVAEMSGVATTLLPDTIVCLLLNNRENLDGAREVLRSILRTRRLRGQPSLDILPVLARVPLSEEGLEAETLETVRTFLHEEADQIEDTLSPAPLLVLHSEPRLQLKESLLIESSASSDSMLLRDYIRLIAQIVPADVLAPHVVPLVGEAMNSAWDAPEKAEKDLMALCEVSSVPEAHQALIKFYSLSKAEGSRILDAAQKYWQMTGRDDDPLLMKVLRANLRVDRGDEADVEVSPEFVEAVWRKDGAKDVDVGFLLARLYRKHERYDRVSETIRSVAKNQDLEPNIVAEFLKMLREANQSALAFRLIDRYKEPFAKSQTFRHAWIAAILKWGDSEDASDFLAIQPPPKTFEDLDTATDYCRLLIQAEPADVKAAAAMLIGRLEPEALMGRSSAAATRQFWRMLQELDLEDELRRGLEKALSPKEAQEVWEGFRSLAGLRMVARRRKYGRP